MQAGVKPPSEGTARLTVLHCHCGSKMKERVVLTEGIWRGGGGSEETDGEAVHRGSSGSEMEHRKVTFLKGGTREVLI